MQMMWEAANLVSRNCSPDMVASYSGHDMTTAQAHNLAQEVAAVWAEMSQ